MTSRPPTTPSAGAAQESESYGSKREKSEKKREYRENRSAKIDVMVQILLSSVQFASPNHGNSFFLLLFTAS